MKFGILFTSHQNLEVESYQYRDVHQRVTRHIIDADELCYDTALIAEHHFSITPAELEEMIIKVNNTREALGSYERVLKNKERKNKI